MSLSMKKERVTLGNKTMSIKEANRLSVVRQIEKKILSMKKASEELGVTEDLEAVLHRRRARPDF